jgi:hypothetical protein
MIVSQPLELVDAVGAISPAEVLLSEGEDAYSVRIRWAGREVSASGSDAFSALCTVREQLSEFGLMPRCYGACRNLVVSGMAAQMGGGLAGYLVRLGQQARMSDLVRIFDAGPDMDLVPVPEQQAFKQAWLRSLGLPS